MITHYFYFIDFFCSVPLHIHCCAVWCRENGSVFTISNYPTLNTCHISSIYILFLSCYIIFQSNNYTSIYANNSENCLSLHTRTCYLIKFSKIETPIVDSYRIGHTKPFDYCTTSWLPNTSNFMPTVMGFYLRNTQHLQSLRYPTHTR